MDGDSRRLQELREQVSRRAHVQAMLEDLYVQEKELREKVENLRQEKEEEQKDVDRLEGRGLTALFYSIIGKMDEKLTKEQKEAYAASAKYESAQQELEAISRNIAGFEQEFRELEGCEAAYRECLHNREQAIKTSGSPAAAEILSLEKRKEETEHQLKEINEALHAGEKAIYSTEAVLGKLESAEAWGTWDMLGGGFISTMAKHGNLDDAQSEIADLQVELRHFKTELVDVSIDADLQIRVDDFLRFADYFFDGIFVDWAVQDRIKKSKLQVQQIREQINRVMDQLFQMQTASEKELMTLTSKMEKLIAGDI